jgi:hypothetical protein
MADRHNPRVNLTLPSDVLEVVKAYSEVLGKPPSTMIRDLLVEMVPMMQVYVEIARKSQKDKEDAFQHLQLFTLNTLGQVLTTITDGVQKHD